MARKRRGFELLTEKERQKMAAKGGASVAPENRTFAKDPEQARRAGAIGGAKGKGRPKPRKVKPALQPTEFPSPKIASATVKIQGVALTQRFPRLHAALDYAAERHREQTRKGTSIAYLSHLLGVSSLVIEHGGDESQAIAGMLHDVIEDCGPEHEPVIRGTFGDRVADIVVACTDSVPDAAGDRLPWRERKEAYLRHLRNEMTFEALLVSACDKLHNARAIATDVACGHDVFARFSGGRDGTLWYYRSLLDVFDARLGRSAPLVIELRVAVQRMI